MELNENNKIEYWNAVPKHGFLKVKKIQGCLGHLANGYYQGFKSNLKH